MKKPLIIIGLAVAVVLVGGGLSLAWDVVEMVATSFYSTFVAILPFLDLEQTALCKIITIAIVQVLCAAGAVISVKTKKKIGVVVSAIADLIATILLLIA